MLHLTTIDGSANLTEGANDRVARAGTLGVVVASLMAILLLIL
jgi:hypothetical protein